MSWNFALIGVLVSVYLGSVVGIYSLCIENPRLHKVKKYSFYVPIFTFFCIFYGIFSTKENRKIMLKFLFVPHKYLIILHFFAESIAKEKTRCPQRVPKRKVVFNGVISGFLSLLQGNKAFYYQL